MKAKIILTVSLVFLLTACGRGGIRSSNHNEVSVSSEPSGASVYVVGELQGSTPMIINLTKLYPATYAREYSHLYGSIVLKRDGCSDRTVKITPDIAGAGLKEKLDCMVSKNLVVNKAVVKKPTTVDKSIKLRLQELQSLKEEGLINEDEYRKIRNRILGSI